MARQGKARPGKHTASLGVQQFAAARPGMARLRPAWQGGAWQGKAWQGNHTAPQSVRQFLKTTNKQPTTYDL